MYTLLDIYNTSTADTGSPTAMTYLYTDTDVLPT